VSILESSSPSTEPGQLHPSTTNPRWEHLTSGKTWYLMGPRKSRYDAAAPYLQGFKILSNRALSEWELFDAFDSREECEVIRDSLRRVEESTYNKLAVDYLQMTGQQPEAPMLSFKRFSVEMSYAAAKAYMASRCVGRGDPGLPSGLKAK
jgi:hypothetical protein